MKNQHKQNENVNFERWIIHVFPRSCEMTRKKNFHQSFSNINWYMLRIVIQLWINVNFMLYVCHIISRVDIFILMTMWMWAQVGENSSFKILKLNPWNCITKIFCVSRVKILSSVEREDKNGKENFRFRFVHLSFSIFRFHFPYQRKCFHWLLACRHARNFSRWCGCYDF